MPIRLSGMVSGLDTDAIIKELMSSQSLKKTNIENKKTKLEWKQEKWEELNTKVYALYTEKLTGLKLQGSYLTKKAVSSDESKAKVSATNAANGSYTLEVKELASAQYVTGADISDKGYKSDSLLTSTVGMEAGQTITITTKQKNDDGVLEDIPVTFEVDGESTIGDLVSKLTEAGLNASFDQESGRFYISSKQSGVDNGFTITSTASGAGGLEALGLGNIDQTLSTTGQIAPDKSTMAVVKAADASVILNGAVLTSSKNTISASGLNIELHGTTAEGSPVNFTVSNDVDAVYDKVKEFIKSYNELLTDMYEKYNADSAKGYNMLTDDEKEAMTEKQVELWEDKIKDSLLRNDTTLNSLMTTFRSAMQATTEVDGKKYDLSSFGIGTGVYTEHGLLHLDGDADDTDYADKTDKLKKALTDDPEGTAKALSDIMSKFYNTLSESMSVSTISSALTFYNDKQIKSQITDYEKQVKSWETRLEDMEERYYKQFSTMESAMAKLQSEQTQLGNMMGF